MKLNGKKLQIFLTIFLSILIAFAVYIVICEVLGLSIQCPVKLFEVKKNSEDFNIYTFMNIRDLELQRQYLFQILKRLKGELTAVINEENGLRNKKKIFMVSNRKIENGIKQVMYAAGISGDDNERYGLGEIITGKIFTEAMDVIKNRTRYFLIEYSRAMRALKRKEREIHLKIDRVTEAIVNLEKNWRLSGSKITNIHKMELNKFAGLSGGNSSTTLSGMNDERSLSGRITNFEDNLSYPPEEGSIILDVHDKNYTYYDDQLRKILDSINNYVIDNEEFLSELTDKLRSVRDVKNLILTAERLEEKGIYEDSLRIYKRLLLFNLSPADREIIVYKIQELTEKLIKISEKRKQNSEAIKLFTLAQEYEKSGDVKKANEVYTKIIKSYPFSDYVSEALERIFKNQKIAMY